MLKKGYTAIELLATLSIMAIMASVTLPSFEAVKNEAKNTKALAEVKTLQGIVERYKFNYRKLPSSLDLAELPSEVNITDRQINDPFTNSSYQLITGQTLSGKEYYVIYSPGSNGAKDYIVDNERIYDQGDDILASNLLIVSR